MSIESCNYSTLREMRAFLEGTIPVLDTHPEFTSIQEAVEYFRTMNEAYFGKKPMEKMQKAVTNLHHAIKTNNTANANNFPERRELEIAIRDTFGFQDCSIYLTNVPGAIDAYTIVPMVLSDKDYEKGSYKKGFYDRVNRLSPVICISAAMIDESGMTDAEFMAIILHELGHNFDHSAWRIGSSWCSIMIRLWMIFKYIMSLQYDKAIDTAVTMGLIFALGGTKPGKEILVRIQNLDNLILDLIPPVGGIVRKVGKAISPAMRFIYTVIFDIKMLSVTAKYPMRVLLAYLTLPIDYVFNTVTRKEEQYADSFATSYGYGPELITALDKMDQHMYAMDDGPLPNLLMPYYDLHIVHSEFLAAMLGDHGSTQQRAIWSIDKLKRDLKESGLREKDKKMIQDEIDRLEKTYDEYANTDTETKRTFTQIANKLIKNWYNGKPYIVLPLFMENYAE